MRALSLHNINLNRVPDSFRRQRGEPGTQAFAEPFYESIPYLLYRGRRFGCLTASLKDDRADETKLNCLPFKWGIKMIRGNIGTFADQQAYAEEQERRAREEQGEQEEE